jgi:hypothetical protein
MDFQGTLSVLVAGCRNRIRNCDQVINNQGGVGYDNGLETHFICESQKNGVEKRKDFRRDKSKQQPEN